MILLDPFYRESPSYNLSEARLSVHHNARNMQHLILHNVKQEFIENRRNFICYRYGRFNLLQRIESVYIC